MGKRRYTDEEIIHELREADVLIGQGSSIARVCKQIGVTNQTDYRWLKTYGGMGNLPRKTRLDPSKQSGINLSL